MLAEAQAVWPEVTRDVMREAQAALSRDLSGWCVRVEPTCNQDVQLAVFLTTHVHLAALRREGHDAPVSLGLSLGEYNHLVHIGALPFADALRLVSARGEAYDAGPRGAMAAVFPLSEEELRPLLAGDVEIANFNSPTQHVVAGRRVDVEATVDRVEEETYARAVVIERRCPMHVPRFAPASAALRPFLEAAPWTTPRRPYLPNVDAEPLEAPTPAQIVERLTRHVHQPVRWRASIDRVVALHGDVLFLEVGPGRVLTDLLRAPWREEPRARTSDWAAAMEALDGAR